MPNDLSTAALWAARIGGNCGKRLICARKEKQQTNNEHYFRVLAETKIKPDRERIVFSENRWKPRPNVNA